MASRQLDWRKIMLRKITLGLIAAASLSVAALAPGSASAHGFHSGWGGGHGGWGVRPSLYINTRVSSCYPQQLGQTPHGFRPGTRHPFGHFLLSGNVSPQRETPPP